MAFVYLLGQSNDENSFKIGVTKGKIEKRMKKLQTGNSSEIYLVKKYETEYPYFIEKWLHSHLFDKRGNGEWFNLSNEDIVDFEKLCEEGEKNIEVLKENNFFKKYMK